MRRAKDHKPLLIVISAPSGAGKTTLCDCLLAECDGIVYSISCTTRPPRGSEIDGRDYFFLTEEEFKRRVAEGSFLEHAVVHGYKYGTLKKTVEDALGEGRSVLMDIDVQGAGQIRDYVFGALDGDPLKNAFVDVFIAARSMDVLKRRMEGRGEDSREVIEHRLEDAEDEVKSAEEYKYVIVNDDLNKAYLQLKDILAEEATVG